ncbi:hypothetical protein BaRGS_00015093 [Batillaria attramentaria]|uniref:Secreted protein n=1 Tax=Batillaria attramentaria TaxID=370345 RepID=A0ABD0L2W5_9CAEN
MIYRLVRTTICLTQSSPATAGRTAKRLSSVTIRSYNIHSTEQPHRRTRDDKSNYKARQELVFVRLRGQPVPPLHVRTVPAGNAEDKQTYITTN